MGGTRGVCGHGWRSGAIGRQRTPALVASALAPLRKHHSWVPAPPLLRPRPSQSPPPPSVTAAPSRWRQRPADERGPRLTATLPAARTWVRARKCRGGDGPWDGGWEGAAASAWEPRGAGSRPWLRHPEGFPCEGRVEWGVCLLPGTPTQGGGVGPSVCVAFPSAPPAHKLTPAPLGVQAGSEGLGGRGEVGGVQDRWREHSRGHGGPRKKTRGGEQWQRRQQWAPGTIEGW